MANKGTSWKNVASGLAFFSLAVVVIVGILQLIGGNLGVLQNWAILIKDLFLTILIAVMAYNFTVGKPKGWKIAFWILIIAALAMCIFGNEAILGLFKK